MGRRFTIDQNFLDRERPHVKLDSVADSNIGIIIYRE